VLTCSSFARLAGRSGSTSGERLVAMAQIDSKADRRV